MFIFYATWIFFTFIIAILYANYYYFNILSLNLYIVTLFVKTYPFTTIFIILVLFLIIVYQYRLYRQSLKNRKNCQISCVDLEKIAHLWLEYEEIEDNIEHKMMKKIKNSFDETKKDTKDIISTLIGNRVIQDISFYKKYVFNYLDFFSKYELEIVAILYELLETKAKDLPSVAILYKNDSDKSIYKNIVSEKLTSYEILYKVDLFTHTMNVVNCMYNILIKENDTFVFAWSRMLISALAHDIGKIEKIESLQGLKLDKGKYENNTHENLSRLILSNAFPNYEYIDFVCEIVEKHHIQNLDEKNKNYKYIQNLKNADKEARKGEIKEYLSNQQETKLLNNNTNDFFKESIEIQPNEGDLKSQIIENVNVKEQEDKEDNIFEQTSTNTKEAIEIKSNNNLIILNQENTFSATDIRSLIELIIKNINEVEISDKTGRTKLLSMSNKNELLIPKDIFTKFSKLVGLNVIAQKDLNTLIKRLKNDEVLKYETSNITLDGFSNLAYKSRKKYLVFSLDSLGICVDEANLKKRNNENLRNVTINKITLNE